MKVERSPVRKLTALGAVSILLVLTSCVTTAPPAAAQKSVDVTVPANLARLVTQGGSHYLLLAVRTPAEYASGHIPTARNLPYDQIAENPPAVDKSLLVITYCASGHRAEIAKKALESLGFTNVVNFGAMSRFPGKLVTGD